MGEVLVPGDEWEVVGRPWDESGRPLPYSCLGAVSSPSLPSEGLMVSR